ncbi:MAG: gliding motility-associated C-terminal domain-containing protein [Urechidicola sp.]|nr:gliding motility-associated C-terminal domain-containing protein [Urechidicola sp.]
MIYTIEGCHPNEITGLPLATTETTITLAELEAALGGGGTASDDLDDYVITYIDSCANFDACIVLVTRTFTITDGCGNTATDTQTITVQDTTAPTFNESLPVDTTVECDNVPTADTLTADDNCSTATVTYNETRTDGSCANDYTLTRVWTATDDCGLETVHTQIVTVQDTTAPTFNESLPVDTTVECDNVPTADTLTADDNCGTADVTYSETRTDGSCANDYILTRVWTATDDCGLETVHTQVVTVQDTTVPTFNESLPTDVTVECDTVPTAATLTGSDNCGTADVTYNETRTDGSCANDYTLTRVWTATDDCGLETVHTQIVTVQDTTAPTFNESLPTDVSVECDSVPTADTLTADDNCSTATVTYSETRTDGTCANDYTLTRVWTATDDCGLETVHTQIVTVQDTTAPTLSNLPDENITVVCDEIPEVAEITFEDNCSSDVDMTFTESETTPDDDGNYTITRDWVFTDECGNEESFTQIINVESGTDTVTTQLLSICIDDLSIDLFTLLADGINTDGIWNDVDITGGLTNSNFNPRNVSLGDYLITYYYIEGCNNNVVEFSVNVNDDCIVLPCSLEEDGLYISKAVTPNGDSVNDTFVVGGELQEGCGFIYEIKIFNRWGHIVFESSNYQNNWDGLHTTGGITIGNTSDLPSGTYYYIVNVVDSGFKPFTGPIYLGK